MESIITVRYDVAGDQQGNNQDQEITYRLLDDSNNPTHTYKAKNLTEFIRLVTCGHLAQSQKREGQAINIHYPLRVMGGVL